MLKKPIYFLLILLSNTCFAQSFLNGNFEINSASVCSVNLSNPEFNFFMSNCTAFGLGDEVDIQNISCGYATPYSGNWFLSLATSNIGNPDAISITLSSSLIAGNNYQFSYFEQANTQDVSTLDSIQIGLSTSPNSFGNIIYSSFPIVGNWSLRIVNFTAPNNGNYITIKNNGNNKGWNFIDSFSFCSDFHLNLGNDTTLCQGQTTILNGCSATSYLWSNGSTDSSINVSSSGSYWLVASNGQCSISDTISIFISNCEEIEIELPNLFTPNGDGVNDNFIPIKYKGILKANLIIFNRWGEEVFSTDNLISGWNGSYKGKICSDGTYFWVVRYWSLTHVSSELHGSLSLLK